MKTSFINQIALIGFLTLGALFTLQAEPVQPKIAFEQTKQTVEKLKYSRICFFYTRGSSPFVRVLENDLAKVTTFELSKKLEDFNVIQRWIHNFDEWTLTKNAYYGKAKSYIGKALEATVSNKYDGSILIDQYKAGFPFSFQLNTMKELSTTLRYMMNAQMTQNTNPNMLFITIEEGLDFNQLSTEELDFINQYFVLQDALNDEIALALSKSLKAARKLCANINNGSGVIPLYGNQSETIIALFNKEFYNFEGKICFPLAVKAVVAGLIIGTAIKCGQDFIAKKVTNKVTDAAKKVSDAVEQLGNQTKPA